MYESHHLHMYVCMHAYRHAHTRINVQAKPGNTAAVARQHRRVLPPFLPAPDARAPTDVQPPLQMLYQHLHSLGFLALV